VTRFGIRARKESEMADIVCPNCGETATQYYKCEHCGKSLTEARRKEIPRVGKPAVPNIEGTKEKFKKPDPSGICPTDASVRALGIGLPIAVVIGVLTHYVGLAVGWVSLVLAGLFLRFCCALPASVVLILLAGLGYPFFVGFANGYATGSLAKGGKCRNPGRSGLMGLATGIVAYGVYLAFCYLVTGSLTISSKLVDVISTFAEVEPSGTPWWMWVAIAIEAAIVLIGSYTGGSQAISENTFCEEHDDWYGEWKEVRLTAAVAEPLAVALATESTQEIGEVATSAEKEYPHLVIKVRKCPTGPSCDVEMAATLVWQVAQEQRGKTKYKEEKEEWFDIMIPHGLGASLEEKLFIQT
jgi:hypothetical protein